MKIAIRADASPTIGIGHIMRTLALCHALPDNSDIRFFCGSCDERLTRLIEKRGHAIIMLRPQKRFDPEMDARATVAAIQNEWGRDGADWVICDRHGTNANWDRIVRNITKRLLVMDDLAATKRECDLILNQNFLPGIAARYEQWRFGCKNLMVGPTYALLDRRYREARNAAPMLISDNDPFRILVAFGGGDTNGALEKTLAALATLSAQKIIIDLVIGPSCDETARIETITKDQNNITLHHAPPDLISLTRAADLVIGAFGLSTWERFCLEVPSVVISISDVQIPPAMALGDEEYIKYLGTVDTVSPQMIGDAVASYITDREALTAMAKRGGELVDGQGAERVAQAMIDYV